MIAVDNGNRPMTVQFNRWLTTKVPCGLMQWRLPTHAEVFTSLTPSRSTRCSTDHVFVFIVMPQPPPFVAASVGLTDRPCRRDRCIMAPRNGRKLARLVSPDRTNARAITTIPDQHNICIVEIHPAITTHPPRAHLRLPPPSSDRMTDCVWPTGHRFVDQHALDPFSFQVRQSDSRTEWAGKNAERGRERDVSHRALVCWTRFNLGPDQRSRSARRREQNRDLQ